MIMPRGEDSSHRTFTDYLVEWTAKLNVTSRSTRSQRTKLIVVYLSALFAAPCFLHADVLHIVDSRGLPVPNAVIDLQGVVGGNLSIHRIDQLDKHFVPFVSAVPVGTLIQFPNSDGIRHHVYSFSDARTFEIKLYRANDADPIQFEKPGLVKLGCNVHDNMKAYVWVTSGSAFVSDANGLVSVPDGILNPGQVTVWHPQLSNPRQMIPEIDPSGDYIIRLSLEYNDADPQAPAISNLRERLQRFQRDAS